MPKSTKSFLVDINVWIAIVYDMHLHHRPAGDWFESAAIGGALFLGLVAWARNSTFQRSVIETIFDIVAV